MRRILEWLGFFSGDDDDSRDFRSIASVFWVSVALGALLLVLRTWLGGDFAVYAIWAMACSVCGGAIGFLFGIPKILQTDAPVDGTAAAAPGYRQQINTNLTEISDWLTKIIVGLSLINLKRIPEFVNGAAQLLVTSVSSGSQPGARGFATAVISSFSMIGFLFGYLSTRMFLAGAFSRADQRALRGVAETSSQVASLTLEVGLLKRKLFPAAEPEAEGRAGGGELAPAAKSLRDEEALQRLSALAASYLAIPSSLDYGTRVRMKDAAANAMADLILQARLPRDTVEALAAQQHNEGLALALATVANAFPEQDDVRRLLAVGSWVTRWHVQYHITTAFGALFRHGFLSDENRHAVADLLAEYRKKGDASLRQAIDSTLAMLARPVSDRIQRQGA